MLADTLASSTQSLNLPVVHLQVSLSPSLLGAVLLFTGVSINACCTPWCHERSCSLCFGAMQSRKCSGTMRGTCRMVAACFSQVRLAALRVCLA